MREELIAVCGMDCRICIAYFGYTMNGSERKNPCIGCKPAKRNCAFIKKRCRKLSKEEVNYCFECDSFPCENLEKLDKRYRTRFEMSMIDNLNFIKKNGIKKFLKLQEEKYKCDECGGVVCVHNGKCYTCGNVRM